MHLHGAGELNGSGQVGTGLLPPSFLALQGAEVKVAMRLKWAHDELLGQGLAVVSFGCLDSVEELRRCLRRWTGPSGWGSGAGLQG